VSEKGNSLLISKEAFRGSDSITIDVTGLDRSTIILLIQSLYTYGYDLITIKSKDVKAKWHWGDQDVGITTIIDYAISRLIGVELVSSTKDTYKIQVITGELREKFDMVLRRIFRLTLELYEAFLDRYRKLDVSLIEQVEFKYLHLRRFMNYALRILNKFGHEDASKTAFYFAVIKSLSRIVETTKNISGPPDRPIKPSKKACDLIEEIMDAFKDFYELFYKYDIKLVSRLHEKRDLFKRKVYYKEFKSLTKEDIYLLGTLIQSLDVMMDLDELKMAIGYK
jgi:phosphate uptake regulator